MPDDSSALWDREAATFDDAADHGLRDPAVRRAWRDLLLPLVGDPGRRIADLGCGTGTLAVLLAGEGRHLVTGVDFSPEMVQRARAKVGDITPEPVFVVGDAADPPLPIGSFDVVVCRHVLWAMPNPGEALARWVQLLTSTGVLILIEGRWDTGAGLTTDECLALVGAYREDVELYTLDDPSYWGRPITDERYLIFSPR